MKPYYEEPGITIYHGDCRDILPSLPKVDLVLTDPPYGINFKSNWKGGSFEKIIGDSYISTSWIYKIKAKTVYCFTRWDVMQSFIDTFNQSGKLKVKDVLIW